jgi:hypothetical protein
MKLRFGKKFSGQKFFSDKFFFGQTVFQTNLGTVITDKVSSKTL